MIKSITGQPGTSYRWEDVARPWNSIDSPSGGKVVPIHCCDTPEQIELCLTCHYKDCRGGEVCARRLGKQKKRADL